MDNLKTLQKLCEINAVSSCEEELKKEIKNMIPPSCKTIEDNLGNVIVVNQSKNKPKNRIVLTANLDEKGLIATKIEEDGSILFSQIGKVKPTSLIGANVSFENGTNGIIGTKPIHLQSEKEKKTIPKFEDLFIDIGCFKKEETEKYVEAGDYCSFSCDFSQIANDSFKSKSLGDRICCLALINLLNSQIDLEFYCIFVVKEKALPTSSKTAAFLVNPNIAIILKPNILKNNETLDSSHQIIAPIKSKESFFDEKLTSSLKEVAKKNKIEIKKEVLNSQIETAKSIGATGAGVRNLAVLICCKEFGFCQVCSKKAIENFLKLIKGFVQNYSEIN